MSKIEEFKLYPHKKGQWAVHWPDGSLLAVYARREEAELVASTPDLTRKCQERSDWSLPFAYHLEYVLGLCEGHGTCSAWSLMRHTVEKIKKEIKPKHPAYEKWVANLMRPRRMWLRPFKGRGMALVINGPNPLPALHTLTDDEVEALQLWFPDFQPGDGILNDLEVVLLHDLRRSAGELPELTVPQIARLLRRAKENKVFSTEKGSKKYEELKERKQKKSNHKIISKKNGEYEYDVVLSFAGEDRDYVERVADFLKDNEIKVFYDKYEEVDLWGKDLYEHLDDVYKNKAEYCIVFISKYYADKIWTTHERKSAQERAIKERKEYILPARFDDTEIPGIRKTTGYINLNEYSSEEFGEAIIDKIGKLIIKDQEPEEKGWGDFCMPFPPEEIGKDEQIYEFKNKYFDLAIIKLGLIEEINEALTPLNHDKLGFKIYDNPKELKKVVVGVINDNSEPDNEIIIKLEGYLNHFQNYKTERKNILEKAREKMVEYQNKAASSMKEQQSNFKKAAAIKEGTFNDALDVLTKLDSVEIILMKELYENKESIENKYNDICNNLGLKPQPKIKIYDKFNIFEIING